MNETMTRARVRRLNRSDAEDLFVVEIRIAHKKTKENKKKLQATQMITFPTNEKTCIRKKVMRNKNYVRTIINST